MNNSSVMPHDIERLIEMDFLRATELAALNTLQWLGKGEKEKADEAACDAIRGMFDLMDISGEVVIGEGIKDEAPGLFKGEKVGTWREGSPKFEIALDPVDGTTNVSKGMPNSISCIAASAPSEDGRPCLQDIPAFYMKKLAYPLEVRRAWMKDPSLPIDIDAPIEEVIDITAKILGKDVRDVVVCVLDRPRNQDLIDAIRRKGRIAAHDRRWRYHGRAGSRDADVRDQSLRRDRWRAGVHSLRRGPALPGRRHARAHLAARRGGEAVAHRARLGRHAEAPVPIEGPSRAERISSLRQPA